MRRSRPFAATEMRGVFRPVHRPQFSPGRSRTSSASPSNLVCGSGPARHRRWRPLARCRRERPAGVGACRKSSGSLPHGENPGELADARVWTAQVRQRAAGTEIGFSDITLRRIPMRIVEHAHRFARDLEGRGVESDGVIRARSEKMMNPGATYLALYAQRTSCFPVSRLSTAISESFTPAPFIHVVMSTWRPSGRALGNQCPISATRIDRADLSRFTPIARDRPQLA